jgi:hypothetical protein
MFYYVAGTEAATADENLPNNTLPVGWVPNAGAVDPLNTAAVNAVYSAGPHPPGLIRPQFTGVSVVPPVTYWLGTPQAGDSDGNGGTTKWSLTGLGATLPAIFE